jgi:hypothetical protein
VEADLFTLEDGLITSIHSMYDPALSRFVYGVDPTDLLTAYASAWSSGDLDALAPCTPRTSCAPRVCSGSSCGESTRSPGTQERSSLATRVPLGRSSSRTSSRAACSAGRCSTSKEPGGCDMQMTVLVEMDDAGLISRSGSTTTSKQSKPAVGSAENKPRDDPRVVSAGAKRRDRAIVPYRWCGGSPTMQSRSGARRQLGRGDLNVDHTYTDQGSGSYT